MWALKSTCWKQKIDGATGKYVFGVLRAASRFCDFCAFINFIAATEGYDARKTASYTTGEGEEGHATILDKKGCGNFMF